MIAYAHVDGAARIDGRSSIGIVINTPSCTIQIGRPLKTRCNDNNIVEYVALYSLLEFALQKKYRQIIVKTDSEIIANHLNGDYRCESKLAVISNACKILTERFDSFKIRHIPEAENGVAHALAKQALESRRKIKIVTKHG